MVKTYTFLLITFTLVVAHAQAQVIPFEQRRPESDASLRFWLENCLWHHGFTHEETTAATGLSDTEIGLAMKRLGMPTQRPDFENAALLPLKVLPYPGGRHPRIGFLDGAIRPQRETKISVFAPWDPLAYVVVDVPEAIWHQDGLYYLAHTHIPTVWSAKEIQLPRLEWLRHADGSLSLERLFPDGVKLRANIKPLKDAVLMKLSLFNGSSRLLQDLRVQNCVMFKGLPGLVPDDESKVTKQGAYIACRNETGTRWVLTAWKPIHRAWHNPPVPCIHADPQFPDCAPGETRDIHGWFSFYQGKHIQDEIDRIENLNWADW